MRIVILFCTLFSIQATAQTFVELCPDEITDGTVVDFNRYNDDILATGFFTEICGESTNYVAKWDGSQWAPSAINLPFAGHFMEQIGSDLFFATYSSGPDSNWLWKYDGSSLDKFGEGIYLTGATEFSNLPNIYDVVEFQGEIIICGEFDKIGSKSIEGVARWNGTSWANMGDLSGNIPNSPPYIFPHQLLVHDNELYVVGNFEQAGGVVVNGIARWDGNVWSPLGAGFNSTVYAIGVYNNEIYAGGDFTKSGDNDLMGLAKWNGSEWSSPGFGFQPANFNDYTFVHTLREINDELWILGGLKEIVYSDDSIELCGGVVSFDGTEIKTYNEGILNNDIEAIIKDDQGEILVGGGIFGNGYIGILDLTISSASSIEPDLIDIYPNPILDLLQIDTELDIEEYEILDVAGRLLVASKDIGRSIDFGKYPAGIYFLRFKVANDFLTKKVIKQ